MGTILDQITYMALADFIESEVLDSEDRAIAMQEMLRLEVRHLGLADEVRRHRRLMQEIALNNADADMSPTAPTWLRYA